MTKVYNIVGKRQTGKTTKAFDIISEQDPMKKVLYYSSLEGRTQSQIENLVDKFGISERYNLVFASKFPTREQMLLFDVVVFDDLKYEIIRDLRCDVKIYNLETEYIDMDKDFEDRNKSQVKLNLKIENAEEVINKLKEIKTLQKEIEYWNRLVGFPTNVIIDADEIKYKR